MNKFDEMIPADASLAWQPSVNIMIEGRRITVSGPADAMHWLLNACPCQPESNMKQLARSASRRLPA
ncbi:hypothetical protein [Rhizobium deserti]|uniref:hypothetical protein n=1 Tax=Rhizobium deserti TaxID=2547961 RepID=UPI00192A3956|nr:hypothetical protein [Rhizobium deserti]